MSSQQPQEPRWDSNQQRWYRYVWTQGRWQSEWLPVNWQPSAPRDNRRDSGTGNYPLASPSRASSSAVSGIPYGRPANVLPRGRGSSITGTYAGPSTLHYEPVDRSYYVRNRNFFFLGRVFSVIMNETAGANATLAAVTDYNTSRSLTRVKYEDNIVYTNVRRFIVVRQRREFCYACPIFTYSGKATTKRGVVAQEHGVAYSWGQQPHLVAGETGITKQAIAVVMTEENDPLVPASRIYYGIHHPIQYNVKVKEIGYVSQDQIHILLGNWAEEEGKDEGTKQSLRVTAHAESSDHLGTLREDEEDNAESEDDGEEEVEEDEEDSVQDPPAADHDRHFYHPTNNPYGYHPKIAPDCYHPEHNPYGYHRQSNPHGYHPASNPHSYHPNRNPYGYHPSKAPFCYHPSYSPFGYHATSNPLGYHPSVTPYNYHPQSNLEGYHAKYNPYGYHPQSNPHGYHPTLSPKGYHPKHHIEAYHPKYHPDGIYFGSKGKATATSGVHVGSSAEAESSSDEEEDTEIGELSQTLLKTSVSGSKGYSSTQAGAYQYSISPPTTTTSPRPHGRRSQDDDTGKGKQRRR